jgi:predicted dehydrogenase
MMRVGVLGAGLAASSHLFDLTVCDGVEPVAVCATTTASAARAAQAFGAIRPYDSVTGMLACEDLDGLVVAVPPRAASAVLPAVAASGLPVILDKPAADSAQPLRDSLRHHRGFGTRAAVAYNRRYQRHTRALRAMLRQGRLGTVQSVSCAWSAPFAARFEDRDTYRAAAGFGEGVLLDTVSHVVDLLQFLDLGPLRVRNARLRRGPAGRTDIGAEVELTGRGCAGVRLAVTEGAECWQVTVRGTAGYAVIDGQRLTVSVGTDREVLDGGDLRRPVEDLFALLHRGAALGASIDEAIETLTVLEAILAAAKSRPWLRPRAKALGRLNGAC